MQTTPTFLIQVAFVTQFSRDAEFFERLKFLEMRLS